MLRALLALLLMLVPYTAKGMSDRTISARMPDENLYVWTKICSYPNVAQHYYSQAAPGEVSGRLRFELFSFNLACRWAWVKVPTDLLISCRTRRSQECGDYPVWHWRTIWYAVITNETQ